jgi:signal transduction histidine kinase
VDGDVERVPTAVGLTAFRIVQEALTNTIRHAEAHTADVRVACNPETVRIEVVDDGRGPTDDRVPGHGLIGMRERVAVYGGSLEAGPGSGGGYRVEALLPYDAEPAS